MTGNQQSGAAQTAFSAQPTTPSRPRARTVALWTAQILLSLFLIVASALPKLAGQEAAVETFDKIGWGQWFRYVTGVVELAGGIGLLIPCLAGLAALGLIGVMVGAVLTQLLVLEPAWALFPVALGVVLGLIAYARRAEIRDLLGSLRR